jgi:UDP-galactopyranose mutase
VFEYPKAQGDAYYPVPRKENSELYAKYKTLADRTSKIHFVGRLATYKYYNMDQIVAQALTTYGKIAGMKRVEAVTYAHGNGNGNGNGNGHGHSRISVVTELPRERQLTTRL